MGAPGGGPAVGPVGTPTWGLHGFSLPTQSHYSLTPTHCGPARAFLLGSLSLCKARFTDDQIPG